jgi:hypothetical protein
MGMAIRDYDLLARLLPLSRAASAKECVLRERVKGHHPGQLDHDPLAWSEWLAAANVVRELADKMRAAEGR